MSRAEKILLTLAMVIWTGDIIAVFLMVKGILEWYEMIPVSCTVFVGSVFFMYFWSIKGKREWDEADEMTRNMIREKQEKALEKANKIKNVTDWCSIIAVIIGAVVLIQAKFYDARIIVIVFGAAFLIWIKLKEK